MRVEIRTQEDKWQIDKVFDLPGGNGKTLRASVHFEKDMTPTAREIFIPDEYWQPSEVPTLIKSLVIFLLVSEAIKKDPSLTEVDTREVWRVAAPLVMDILGAVWGE